MILPDMTQMLASAWKSKPKKDAKNMSRMLVHLSSMVRPSYSQLLHETITIPSKRPWPVLKVASIQCWAAHQCVILEKNWASTGDHGKIWENLLEKRGRKSWRKKRKLGIDLGVIASYRDWCRYSVSIIVTSTETFPTSQIHPDTI